jgi:hypothetical protein
MRIPNHPTTVGSLRLLLTFRLLRLFPSCLWGPWDAVWRLVFGKPANGWWGLTEGPINANAVPALAFAGATTNSRGNAWLPRGFYMGQLGGAASRIFVNVAALRPAGGGTQGDIVFNKNAAVGQPMGWVYDGTQWRDLPNIT